ncbi:C40 family peptidase [Nocardiopsis potens]|uniref:C40 family peptidase n=1 Tax=Nocardiopsis potens TaxID=1246458 RepID=UPI000361F195|nr:C40 family peptidase [Nocardiopsis potens]
MQSIAEEAGIKWRNPDKGIRWKGKPGVPVRTCIVLSAVLALCAAEGVAAPEASASAVAEKAAEYALDQVGKPYRYGGRGPDGFDCSGLVQWSFEKAGRSVGRTTHDQYRKGSGVKRSRLRKGDMVFFYSGPSHVGIALGDGRMVHAPSSGKKIQVVRMADYFDAHFTGARRIS